MASKLRKTGARVSFFAFQDMITTVTGVLLLVTLLLTLYLNQPPSSPAHNDRDKMRQQVAKAQSELDAKLAQLQARQVEEIAATNRIFVVPEPDRSGRIPILVVLSATNGICMTAGQANAEQFATGADSSGFERLLEQWNPARQRLVFYIRPSGITNFLACRDAALQRSFQVGFDAAEEDRQYVLASP